MINADIGVRGGGPGGTDPPGWCKVSKFRAKFWPLSYILGDFVSKVWAILPTKLHRKTPKFGNHLIWTETPSQFK